MEERRDDKKGCTEVQPLEIILGGWG